MMDIGYRKPSIINRSSGITYNSFVIFLCYLLALSISLPEARFTGISIKYPNPSLVVERTIGLPYLFEVIIILLAITFFSGLVCDKFIINHSWKSGVLGLIIYLAILIFPYSLIIGLEPGVAAFGQARMLFEGFIVFFIITNIKWNETSIKIIAWIFIVSAFINAVLILISYFYPSINLPLNIIPMQPYDRFTGLFSQPSRASLLLITSLGILIPLVILNNSKYRKVVFLIGTIIALTVFAGVFLAQTRGAIIALFIIGLYFIYRFRYFLNKFIYILISITFLIFGLLLLVRLGIWDVGFSRIIQSSIGSDSSGLNFQYEYINESFYRQRGAIWEEAIDYVLSYPMGMGYDTLATETGYLPHAHNQFLQWAIMFGIIGLLLLLYFVLRILLESNRVLLNMKTNKSHLLALQAGFIGYIVASQFEPFLITTSGYWFWLIAGLLVTIIDLNS